jgi:N-terminal 7TM region of histidine kinase
MGQTPPTNLLLTLNDLLSAAVLIVTFALLAYLLLQNRESPVARALCVLLAGIVVVFGGDVLIGQIQSEATIAFMLRAQWLGIVSVPAGYLHLTHALLSYGGQTSNWRRWYVLAGYLISGSFFVLALGTDLLLSPGVVRGPLAQFGAGPLFSIFAIYFALACMLVFGATLRVRRLVLTPILRRRLTYLAATVLGPGLAVFPYLVIANPGSPTFDTAALLLLGLGNAAIAIMTIVAVYSIGFQGMSLPDRIIRQDFVRWWLYGPVVGITIVLFVRGVPPLARMLGVSPDILLTFGIMIMTVLMPIFVTRAKPYLDALVYTQDHGEIDYLRALPRSTFTQTDLRSLLENTLIAICGALRIETGFVAAADEDNQYTIKTVVGARRDVKRFVNEQQLGELVQRLAQLPVPENGALFSEPTFINASGFCLLPLRDPNGSFIGALGVGLPPEALTADARRLVSALSHQIEMALTTVHMQQRLFETLRDMGPEIESLQLLSTRLEQATPASLDSLKTEVALLPDFPQIVKDTLAHYWGGPKLSDSPLLGLRSVRRMLDEQGGSPTRALQAVLRQAIENLRPDAQLDPSAQEWVLYNILEMRFLQGRRIRDTADRLAMSESDLYRKQRIAVEEVARQLALMEESERR